MRVFVNDSSIHPSTPGPVNIQSAHPAGLPVVDHLIPFVARHIESKWNVVWNGLH